MSVALCAPWDMRQAVSFTHVVTGFLRFLRSPSNVGLSGSLGAFSSTPMLVLCWGNAAEEKIVHQPVLEVLSLEVRGCDSRGHVAPQSIDIGTVGHQDGWRDVPFSICLQNPGCLPLLVQAVSPPDFIHYFGDMGSTESSSVVIPPFSSASVEGIFKSSCWEKENPR